MLMNHLIISGFRSLHDEGVLLDAGPIEKRKVFNICLGRHHRWFHLKSQEFGWICSFEPRVLQYFVATSFVTDPVFGVLFEKLEVRRRLHQQLGQ
jgi:hypothetical protein